jgi:hypothetical protein
MADMQGRKVFKVFNQDFAVDERYEVTKELGQGAYGIVWYVVNIAPRQGFSSRASPQSPRLTSPHSPPVLRPIKRTVKESPSRRLPMSSARKS